MSVPPPTPLPTLSDSAQVKVEPDTEEASQSLKTEPLSEWQSLRQRVEENPYNTTAWEDLVENAELSGDQDKVKEAYESLLEKFPNTVGVCLFSPTTINLRSIGIRSNCISHSLLG